MGYVRLGTFLSPQVYPCKDQPAMQQVLEPAGTEADWLTLASGSRKARKDLQGKPIKVRRMGRKVYGQDTAKARKAATAHTGAQAGAG